MIRYQGADELQHAEQIAAAGGCEPLETVGRLVSGDGDPGGCGRAERTRAGGSGSVRLWAHVSLFAGKSASAGMLSTVLDGQCVATFWVPVEQ
jgi:hypothetical protein